MGVRSFVSVALTAAALPLVVAAPAFAAGRQLVSSGTIVMPAASVGADTPLSAAGELAPDVRPAEGATPAGPLEQGSSSDGVGVGSAGSELGRNFLGLNLRDQRLANGGNQFTVEPPDQGLCAGNGFVVESANDVIRVFHTDGTAATGVIDLNTFYGYPAQLDRTTGLEGPFVTDPSCYYDGTTHRWFHTVLTLEVDPITGDFLGGNHLDLAVSESADPTGAWRRYQFQVQDDGTNGTPDHGCSLNADGSGHGPCIGDYPHLGVDANGVYLTTNEYSLFGPEFKGAQIYAISKAALVHATPAAVTQFATSGFTIWPATAPASANASAHNGTEYLLSGLVSAQPNGETPVGSANRVAVWAISNTASLNGTAALSLTSTTSEVSRYAAPPTSDQKAGDVPLADALNLDAFGFGVPAVPEVEGRLDSNDGRMQQVTYFNGRLYGALDTAVRVGGEVRAGSAWFVIRPSWDGSRLAADTVNNGTVAVRGNNVNYPAVGVTTSGKAVMAFTLVGQTHYPSAAYVLLRADGSTSNVRVVAEGLGPQDGFSEYTTFGGRARWGDYGATAVIGNTVWAASEYIAQTCTTAQYFASTSCGGTRVTLGNWATRVSAITP